MEYPDGSFTQPKLKPAWMGKKHLQCGQLQQSLTATKLILGWVLAALQGNQQGSTWVDPSMAELLGMQRALLEQLMLHEGQLLTGLVENLDPLGLLAGCELPDHSCLTLLSYPLQVF